MKIGFKNFVLVVTLMGCFSTFAGELPAWKEEPPLQLNGHRLRYASMDYGDTCQGYSHIGVVHLHGSSPDSSENSGGAFDVAWSSKYGVIRRLSQWFRSICARVVAPDSGLKFSLKHNRADYKRWDSNNDLGGFERMLIFQLMDKMIREQGITELYIIGFSSGSMMVHNVALDLINRPYGTKGRVKKALKGIVMADGISANQVRYLDNRYIGVNTAWWNHWFITDIRDIGGIPDSDPAPPNPNIACKSSTKPVSTTFFAREHGIYVNHSYEITGLLANKKWDIPTLIINSLNDSAINLCLKTNFAQSMSRRGVYISSAFGHSIRNRYVNSSHDSSIWSIGFPLIQRALLDAHNSH